MRGGRVTLISQGNTNEAFAPPLAFFFLCLNLLLHFSLEGSMLIHHPLFILIGAIQFVMACRQLLSHFSMHVALRSNHGASVRPPLAEDEHRRVTDVEDPLTGRLPMEQALLNLGGDASLENADAVDALSRANPAFLLRVTRLESLVAHVLRMGGG